VSDLRRVGVAFFTAGPVVECDAGDLPLARGDEVMVAAEGGPVLGRVVVSPEFYEGREGEPPTRTVLRRPTADDRATREWAAARGRAALKLAYTRAAALDLVMKFVSVEFTPSGSLATVYFVADDRIDFRGLVKDLATGLSTRVEMRQIGPRDSSKVLGGLGPCGRELCCSSFLHEFEPVSIKMAKDQGLALHPQKISGMCGRLMCCLSYEHEGYVENAKAMPKVGKMVTTPKGPGRVVSQEILEKRVRVMLDDRTVESFAAGLCEKMPPPPPTPPASSSK
jgi:cell fate regulator YaaT (PSP1 superfamily)